MPLPPNTLSAARRILVARLDGIGDVVLTVPMLRGLRRSAPEARITLLVSPVAENFVQRCPYIDQVLVYGIRRAGAGRGKILLRHAGALARLVPRLRKRRFDLAISPRWDVEISKTGLITYLSGAPFRVAYASTIPPLAPRWSRRYYTDLLEPPPAARFEARHEVLRNLDLLEQIGGTWQSDDLECWPTENDSEVARLLLAEAGIGAGERLIAMCPGAGSRRRMWPIERFAEIGRWLCQENRCRLALVGGPSEEHLGRALVDRLGSLVAIDSIGRLTLRQTAALLKRCRMYVGNDTGIMHIASAVGLPCVEISCHPRGGDVGHANSPARFHPWKVPYRVAQPSEPVSPCREHCEASEPHCILNVTADQVKSLAGELLAEPGEDRSGDSTV